MIATTRLTIRPWRVADAGEALAIYGDPLVSRWLAPVQPRVADEFGMRLLLRQWTQHVTSSADPVGHWAVARSADGRLVGALAIRDLSTGDGDLELAWQLARHAWGRGYAVEAARALATWALDLPSVDELLALVRPANHRSLATALRIGMDWVGETEKFHGLRLQVFRLRAADLLPPTVVAGRVDAPLLPQMRERIA